MFLNYNKFPVNHKHLCVNYQMLFTNHQHLRANTKLRATTKRATNHKFMSRLQKTLNFGISEPLCLLMLQLKEFKSYQNDTQNC